MGSNFREPSNSKERIFICNQINFIKFNIFSFNKIIYKQDFGTPMDSILSLIISDLVLQDLEQLAII